MRVPIFALFIVSFGVLTPAWANPPGTTTTVDSATDNGGGLFDEGSNEDLSEEDAAAGNGNTGTTDNGGVASNDEPGENEEQKKERQKKEELASKEREQGLPPVVVEHEKQAQQALAQGDTETAAQHIQAARELAPQDEKLALLEKLIVQKVGKTDSRILNKEIDSFLDFKEDDQAGPGFIEASPLALGGAARPQPGLITGASRNPFHPDASQDAANKMRLRDFSAAETVLTKKLAEDPKDWRSWRDRALVRLKLKKPHPAKADALRAKELQATNSSVLRVLALALVEIGQLREAVTELTLAVKAEPRDALALAARADVHGRLGMKAEQLADLKAAAEIDPQFEALYAELSGAAKPKSAVGGFSTKTAALYGGAASMALLFFSFALFRKRGETAATTKKPAPAMRLDDRLGGKAPVLPQGFQVVRQLGQGGMGVVFEATDEILQRKVALKKMRPEIAMDPRERRRFLKEARTVAALKHPNIVEIYSVLEREDSLYLIFELVNGQNLSELVDGNPLSPAAAVRLARQIAQALDYAHQNGVIHQDLKPSNIMIGGDGAKVMDFGIARRTVDTLSTISRNQVVGTPAYMAPEQEQSLAAPASDQYSLALCLYEMLAGRMAYPVSATVFQKVERQYRPLSELAKVPKEADDVLARALDPNPLKRFPSAGQLISEFEHSLLAA